MIDPMNMNNKVVATVFAFRETGARRVLSLLTVDGGNEMYELPTGEAGEGDASLRDVAVRALLAYGERIRVEADRLLQVPFEGPYAAVYAAVLPEYPGRPMGTHWVDVSLDGTLPEKLAYDHDTVFGASVGMLLASLVSPSFRFPEEDPEMRARLWDALMSGERRSAWLDSIRDLGVRSSATEGGAKTANELKRELTERMMRELKLRKEAEEKDVKIIIPETEQGKFVYDYIHPSLTVDIVVLSVNERGELMVPLTVKEKTAWGAGMWSLPGGFVEWKDYIKAKWEPGKDYKDFKSKTEYLEYVREGKSVVDVAARRILKEKTGIVLPERTTLYQLTSPVQDNPRHGAIDGAPIISRAFLAVVPDYKAFENAPVTSEFVAGPARWFPIRRKLFRGKELVLEEQGEVIKEAAVWVDGKKTPLLTYDRSLSDGYLADGYLAINHFQGLDIGALKAEDSPGNGEIESELKKKLKVYPGRVALGLDIAPGQELFGHHVDVIVDALELISEKSYTKTILLDLLIKRYPWYDPGNVIKFDEYKKARDAVRGCDPSVRQNLFDKEVIKELDEDKERKKLEGELIREKLSKKSQEKAHEEAKDVGLDSKDLKGRTKEEIIEMIIDKKIADAAKKVGLEESAMEGKMREEIVDMVIDAMAYKWMDPWGVLHRITNNGFLVKKGYNQYFVCPDLYQRFLDNGSII